MNSWCPVCSNNCPKQAAEKFYQKVKDKEGITLGIYNGAYNKVTVQCKNGHIYDIIPHNLMSLDTWCPKCSNNCPEKAKEKFIQTVKNKSGVVIGEYINSHTKIKVMCVKGHEWDAVPSSVNAGFWCRACAGTCPIEGYKRLLDIVTLNKGEILSSYINSQTKVTFRCEFGHIWETCPSNITNSNCWCTVCSESNGERHVRHILTKLNIQVLTTKTHPCLKKKRYDFVFIHNDKMFYLEYDGKQHFEKIEFFSKTDEHHNYKRYVDILKSQTVISNGDYLIRIDYTVKDEDIETHILNAINGNEKLYLSNPDMYKWITININSTLNPIPNPLKLEIIRPTHTSGFQEQSLFRQSTIPYMRLNVIK
jgi:hypothetical protein